MSLPGPPPPAQDVELTSKYLWTAMHAWNNRQNGDLDDFEYPAGVRGEEALLKAVEDIYAFADDDLVARKTTIIKEITEKYDNAEHKLDRVDEIVTGVLAASTASSTVSTGLMFVPGIGPLLSAGVALADGIQQVSTQPETQRRMEALYEAISALNELDIPAMDVVDRHNQAFSSIHGLTGSYDPIQADKAKGFLMMLQLARNAEAGFVEFIEQLTDKFIRMYENFDSTVAELEELSTGVEDIDFRPDARAMLALNIPQHLQFIAFGVMALLQFFVKRRISKIDQAAPDRLQQIRQVGNRTYKQHGALKGNDFEKYKAQIKKATGGLKKGMKALKGAGAVLGLASAGVTLSLLVKSKEDYEELRADFETYEGDALAHVNQYIKSMKAAQKALGIVPPIPEE